LGACSSAVTPAGDAAGSASGAPSGGHEPSATDENASTTSNTDGSPEGDRDRDGVPDAQDNCPEDPNRDQSDEDGDGVGDLCTPKPPECTAKLFYVTPGRSQGLADDRAILMVRISAPAMTDDEGGDAPTPAGCGDGDMTPARPHPGWRIPRVTTNGPQVVIADTSDTFYVLASADDIDEPAGGLTISGVEYDETALPEPVTLDSTEMAAVLTAAMEGPRAEVVAAALTPDARSWLSDELWRKAVMLNPALEEVIVDPTEQQHAPED